MSPPTTHKEISDELFRKLRKQLPVDRIEIQSNSNLCAKLSPETGGELAFITRTFKEYEIPLRFKGTRPPRSRVYAELDFSRLSRIQDLDEPSQLLMVQSGVTAGALEKWLNVHQWSLGWYAPAVEEQSLSQILQLGAPAFARTFCGTPLSSIRGYRSILPDGQECWSPPGPLRATGPDLLSLYEGGFSFGMLTQLWIKVHPYPQQETIWTLRANELPPLLEIARAELQDAAPPRQVLLTRAPSTRKKVSSPWNLLISWRHDNPKGITFENRLRFHKDMRRAALQRIHEAPPIRLAPEAGANFFKCRVPIDPDLVDALQNSPSRWVLSVLNSHEAQAWSMSNPDPQSKESQPVLEWRAEKRKKDLRRANKMTRAFLEAIDQDEHFANRL